MRLIASVLVAVVCSVGFLACSCSGDKPPGGNAPVEKTSRFFLPTGEPRNTTRPRVEVDANGNLHMVYPASSVGDAFYAYCRGNCSSAEQVKVVRFSTQGTVDNAMVALGPDGRPHVLLSTYQRAYYASCTGDCSQQSSWTVSSILEHGGKYEISGEAFALTPEGHPRFIMHGYRSLRGATPSTFYVQCDSACQTAASWHASQISDQTWQEVTLRFNSSGQARLTATKPANDGSSQHKGSYGECDANCSQPNDWKTLDLYDTFSSLTELARMYPSVSMALTSSGKPRVVLLGADEGGSGERNLVYAECDGNCLVNEGWQAQFLIPAGSDGNKLRAGVDLALDAQNRPRLVYTADYNILLAHCDADCTDPDKSTWQLKKVEFSGDMQADKVIPYSNCTMASWFLFHPSLAIGRDGLPRVAYQAADISGGGSHPEPGTTPCSAGADMTFARFSQLDSLRPE